MQDFQARVVQEQTELHEKVDKLGMFFQSSTFSNLPPEERTLLTRQFAAMVEYEGILNTRVSRFK